MAEFHNQAKIKLRIVVLAVVVVKCSNNKKTQRRSYSNVVGTDGGGESYEGNPKN